MDNCAPEMSFPLRHYRGLVLILGAVGRANMWAAVFADVGVSVIAILNAIRAMRVKQFETPAQARH